MSFFKRLFTSSGNSVGLEPEAPPVEPSKRGDGTWQIEVVGESFYQDAIARLAGPKLPDGVSFWGMASLVPDPKSTFDKNAVKVMLNGIHVGHLPRTGAPVMKDILREMGLKQMDGIKAHVTGGWQNPAKGKEDPEGSYSVRLHIPRDIARRLKEAIWS